MNLFPDGWDLIQKQFTFFSNNVADKLQLYDIIGVDRKIVFYAIMFIMKDIFFDIDLEKHHLSSSSQLSEYRLVYLHQ